MKKFIRRPQINFITKLSDSTLTRMEKRGDFPPRIKIGVKAVGWAEDDVIEWLNHKQSASIKLNTQKSQGKD